MVPSTILLRLMAMTIMTMTMTMTMTMPVEEVLVVSLIKLNHSEDNHQTEVWYPINHQQQQQQIIIIITRGKIVVPVSVKVFSVSVLTGVLFVVEQLMQVVVLSLTLAQQQMIVFLVYV